MAAGELPLYGAFFGDFGSGLRREHGLFAVLPQLPDNLSSGFTVQLGCGGGSAPTLVLGLTEAIRFRVRSCPGTTSHIITPGRIEDAAQLGRRALDLAREHKQRGQEVEALRLLGAVAARRDPADVREAEAHYRSPMGLAHELGMRPLSANCHLGLGRLYRRTGQRQEAQAHLAVAATMYREMDMRFWLELADGELRALA